MLQGQGEGNKERIPRYGDYSVKLKYGTLLHCDYCALLLLLLCDLR